MTYIDRYIYAVTKYLPEKDREEVARELRANIEDMLEGDYSEENVTRVLEDMGSPYDLSLEYMGKDNYLIGPRVYHIYLEVLKIIALVAVIIGIITFAVDLIFNAKDISSLSGVIGIIVDGFGTIISMLFGFFFWVTLVFVIIERTNAMDEIRQSMDKPFKVTNLKEVPKTDAKKISKVEMVITLVLTVVFLFIFLFRSDLIAIYVPGEGTYELFNAETIRSYSLLIIGVGAFSILVTSIKLLLGRWNEMLGVLSAVYALVSLFATVLILTDKNLFNLEAFRVAEGMIRKTGVDFSLNLTTFVNGIIAVSCFFTLIEIGTSLYNGFRKDQGGKWIGQKN